MAKLKYIKTTSTVINTVPINHGQILYCNDNTKVYYDNRLDRKMVYNIIIIPNDSDTNNISNPSPYKLYISDDLGKFYIYDTDDKNLRQVVDSYDIQFILGDEIALVPTTIVKQGIAYAPRTLASCVYDDDGHSILDSISGGTSLKAYSIEDGDGWYRIAKANIQELCKSTFIIAFNTQHSGGFYSFVITSQIDEKSEYTYIDYLGDDEIKKIRICKKVDGTAYVDIFTDKDDLMISTILVVNQGWKLTPVKKVNSDGSENIDESGLYNDIIEYNINNLDSILNKNTGNFAGNGKVTKIEHKLNTTPIGVFIQPCENQDGTQGDYWVTYDETYIYVYNTGVSTKTFYWVAITSDTLSTDIKSGIYDFSANSIRCTINHNKNKLPIAVLLTPIENTNGNLGECYVEFDNNNIYVVNTGLFNGKFNVLMIFDPNDESSFINKYIKRGTYNFDNSKLITIPHGLDIEPSSVFITPLNNTNGLVGEVWAYADNINIYICNTGSGTSEFIWTAFIGQSKNNSIISNILDNINKLIQFPVKSVNSKTGGDIVIYANDINTSTGKTIDVSLQEINNKQIMMKRKLRIGGMI